MDYINCLPNEILVIIFKYLPLVINLKNRRICVKWYNLISSIPRPIDIGLSINKVKEITTKSQYGNPVVIDNKLILGPIEYCDNLFNIHNHELDLSSRYNLQQMNNIVYWTNIPHSYYDLVHVELTIQRNNQTRIYNSYIVNGTSRELKCKSLIVTIKNSIIIEDGSHVFVLNEINNELVCVFDIDIKDLVQFPSFIYRIYLDDFNNLIIQVLLAYGRKVITKMISLETKTKMKCDFTYCISYYVYQNGNFMPHIITDRDPRFDIIQSSILDKSNIFDKPVLYDRSFILYNGFILSFYGDKMRIYGTH